MQVVQRIYPGNMYKPTVKQAINTKLKILREFYIVDDKNEEEIRKQLSDAIKAHPNTDYEHVLDQVAHRLIAEKL